MLRLLSFLAAIWLLCASPASAAEPAHAALVKSVTGSVTVNRGGEAIRAEGGLRLRVSDRIVTAPDATAAIVFRDGTMLTIGGDAEGVTPGQLGN